MGPFAACFGRKAGPKVNGCVRTSPQTANPLAETNAGLRAPSAPVFPAVGEQPGAREPRCSAAVTNLSTLAPTFANGLAYAGGGGLGHGTSSKSAMPQGLRDTMIMESSPAIITVLTCVGSVLHQNPQSKAYLGDRVESARDSSEDVLALIFAFEPDKGRRMLEELCQGGSGLWKAVVRVPHCLSNHGEYGRMQDPVGPAAHRIGGGGAGGCRVVDPDFGTAGRGQCVGYDSTADAGGGGGGALSHLGLHQTVREHSTIIANNVIGGGTYFSGTVLPGPTSGGGGSCAAAAAAVAGPLKPSGSWIISSNGSGCLGGTGGGGESPASVVFALAMAPAAVRGAAVTANPCTSWMDCTETRGDSRWSTDMGERPSRGAGIASGGGRPVTYNTQPYQRPGTGATPQSFPVTASAAISNGSEGATAEAAPCAAALTLSCTDHTECTRRFSSSFLTAQDPLATSTFATFVNGAGPFAIAPISKDGTVVGVGSCAAASSYPTSLQGDSMPAVTAAAAAGSTASPSPGGPPKGRLAPRRTTSYNAPALSLAYGLASGNVATSAVGVFAAPSAVSRALTFAMSLGTSPLGGPLHMNSGGGGGGSWGTSSPCPRRLSTSCRSNTAIGVVSLTRGGGGGGGSGAAAVRTGTAIGVKGASRLTQASLLPATLPSAITSVEAENVMQVVESRRLRPSLEAMASTAAMTAATKARTTAAAAAEDLKLENQHKCDTSCCRGINDFATFVAIHHDEEVRGGDVYGSGTAAGVGTANACGAAISIDREACQAAVTFKEAVSLCSNAIRATYGARENATDGSADGVRPKPNAEPDPESGLGSGCERKTGIGTAPRNGVAWWHKGQGASNKRPVAAAEHERPFNDHHDIAEARPSPLLSPPSPSQQQQQEDRERPTMPQAPRQAPRQAPEKAPEKALEKASRQQAQGSKGVGMQDEHVQLQLQEERQKEHQQQQEKQQEKQQHEHQKQRPRLRGPSLDAGPECWHEVWATAARDPITGDDVIILNQMNITAKVIAERHLALVMETEHRLVEQLFPRHILQYITEEWTTDQAAAAAELGAVAGRGGGGGSSANSGRGGGRCSGGSLRWRPVVRDCNALATCHPEVTLLFADIKGFTPMCKEMEPRQVMSLLNSLYSRYDAMLDKYGVYKVETIGDCYFVAGGLIHEDQDGMAAVREGGSTEDPLHAEKVFMFAKAMLSAAREVLMPTTGQPVEIRIGLHTGPVVSGVVGTRMPRFCLFGDTVNTASRMESTGVPGAIHASEATYNRLPRSDQWEPTGGIEVKGKGLMRTYVWRPQGLLDISSQTPWSSEVAMAAAAAAAAPPRRCGTPASVPLPTKRYVGNVELTGIAAA